MTKCRVLLLESIHPAARESLTAAGLEVDLFEGALDGRELAERLAGVHAIGIRSKTTLTREVLEAADELVAVGAFCIGVNQVDLAAATPRGVAVFNAPFSNTRSVAELVIAEIVMLSRNLGDRVRQMHEGRWRKTAAGAREVRGKTVGVIGYGHIGSQVGVLAEAFGMRVVFYDVAQKLPMGNNRACPELDQLLAESHFVTLHVPETAQTRGMLGVREIERMRPGACLLNLSRGSVVDIPALADALRRGHIGGAAIDVFPSEPSASSDDGFESELRGLDNVILTPHIGGSTLEAQENIGREVSGVLVKYFQEGATGGSVNFPRLELARHPGAHRLTNVHENQPGVLRDINRIVSEAGANVAAQVLDTSSEIGYVVMDLDQPVTAAVCEEMNALDSVIRARALD